MLFNQFLKNLKHFIFNQSRFIMKKFIQLIKATGCRSNLLSIFSKGKKLIDIRLNKVAYFFDIECCMMLCFINDTNISLRSLNSGVYLRYTMTDWQRSIFKY